MWIDATRNCASNYDSDSSATSLPTTFVIEDVTDQLRSFMAGGVERKHGIQNFVLATLLAGGWEVRAWEPLG